MSDAGMAALWGAIFAGGVVSAVLVHARGVPTTYVRDLLHVGAGSWVLGWPFWHAPGWPLAIVIVALLLVHAVPRVVGRVPAAARFHDSVASGDERWLGLERYTISFAGFTALGLLGEPFPAAAALLALSLGDGLGGLVGRRFGRHFFAVPGGKRKSFEGSLTVMLGATAGAALAAGWWGLPIAPARLVLAGVVAGLAEALAPAASDNLAVPAAVWLALGPLT